MKEIKTTKRRYQIIRVWMSDNTERYHVIHKKHGWFNSWKYEPFLFYENAIEWLRKQIKIDEVKKPIASTCEYIDIKL